MELPVPRTTDNKLRGDLVAVWRAAEFLGETLNDLLFRFFIHHTYSIDEPYGTVKQRLHSKTSFTPSRCCFVSRARSRYSSHKQTASPLSSRTRISVCNSVFRDHRKLFRRTEPILIRHSSGSIGDDPRCRTQSEVLLLSPARNKVLQKSLDRTVLLDL